MPSELTLTYTDESGGRRRAAVRQSPFNIGRGPNNDLVIALSNLSRRHARVEVLGGKHCISDCGSSNGTAVNGRRVTGAVELHDGDQIDLGNACVLSVSLYGAADGRAAEEMGASRREGAAAATPSASPPKAPIIAGVAVGLLLLGSLALTLLWAGPGDAGPPAATATPAGADDSQPRAGGEGADVARATRTPGVVAVANVEPGAEGGAEGARRDEGAGAGDVSDEQAASAVRRVMRRISTDEAAYVSEQGVMDVARQMRAYSGSAALAERLRAMSRGRAKVTALAQSHNLKPALLMYAAIAQTEGGGDPVAAAQQMTPKLLTLRATFGTETANSSLLLVAAYPYPFNPPLGSQARTPHPLAARLTEFGGKRSVVDTSVARSIWFLREKNGITDEAYRLVVRLLAVGAIAQSPRRYGVEADPLW
ncbi:MAG TPA: FHA domain-containing protein [Pyrinomonadaceae bacterium]|nr:FHA domain-containing protein [Pyrinomonadaceae bacterium]